LESESKTVIPVIDRLTHPFNIHFLTDDAVEKGIAWHKARSVLSISAQEKRMAFEREQSVPGIWNRFPYNSLSFGSASFRPSIP
jgi:hypothetical protein